MIAIYSVNILSINYHLVCNAYLTTNVALASGHCFLQLYILILLRYLIKGYAGVRIFIKLSSALYILPDSDFQAEKTFFIAVEPFSLIF